MADTRRLTVNPDSLKIVTTRPGDPAPDRAHVLALKLTRSGPDCYRTSRISVHREGCHRTPSAEGWTVDAATRDEISRILDKADQDDVPVSISCRICGGWSTLP